jgi:hypothetical protein
MDEKKIFMAKMCKCGRISRFGEWVSLEKSFSAFMARLLVNTNEDWIEITIFKDTCNFCKAQKTAAVYH